MKNHYKTLGLQEDASQEEIQNAYERLSKELNPSENGNTPFFIEEYSKIQDAYNALRNSSILSSKIYNSAIQKSNSKLDSNSEEEIKISFSRSKRKKYFGIAFVIILLLSISAFLFYLYSPVVTNWYYKKGIENFEKEDYKAAIPYLNIAIERNDSKYIYFQKRAISRELLKNYKGAIHDYKKAILLNPNNDSLYAFIGSLKISNGDITGFSDFKKGLFINSKSSFLYEQRGVIRTHVDDYPGAIKDFTKAILINPSSNNYYRRGFCKYYDYDYKGAIVDFTKCIENCKEIDEEYYELAFYTRGEIKFLFENNIGAISDYSKAISLNNKNYEYYFKRGFVKFKLKDFRGAINDYSKCVKLNPKFELGYFNIGAAYDNLNNIDKACEFYSKAGDLGYEEAYERIKSNCN